jgi:hypothetical protein
MPDLDSRYSSVEEFLSALDAVASSSAIPPRDPLQVLARANDVFGRGDRKILLADFGAAATAMRNEFDKYVDQLRSQSVSGVINIDRSPYTKEVKPEYDEVPCAPAMYFMKPRHHQILHCICYQFAAKGSKCVLLAATGSSQDNHLPQFGAWTQVLSFERGQQPSLDRAIAHFQEFYQDGADYLTQKVLGHGLF